MPLKGASGVVNSDATVLPPVKKIDALIRQSYQRFQVEPNPLTTDAQFLRRAYLGIVGRIPSYEEARSFLESDNPQKRTQLIEQLFDSEGYLSSEFNYWADILRVKSRLPGPLQGGPYIVWLKEAIRQNMPYDQFVYELLTAQGSAWAPGNGSTGYYLRDSGMNQENMANTMRIFLGTQIQCAQCHDHPFDDWTRKQFLQMAAYTHGISTRRANREFIQTMRQKFKKEKITPPPEAKASLRLIANTLSQGVRSSPQATIPVPEDYQYDDLTTGELVSAKPLYGQPVKGARQMNPQEAYALWLTSKNNDRFTKTIANRLWKKVMGWGLIEPVDDLKDSTEASHPQLLNFLESLMIDLDYDLKKFQKILYQSELFQRQASSFEPEGDRLFSFAGPRLHRMKAEQIWDSILTLVDPEVDSRKGVQESKDYSTYYQRFVEMSAQEIMELAQEINATRQNRRKYQQEIQQLNQEIKTAQKEGDNQRVDQLNRKKRQWQREMKQSEGSGSVTDKLMGRSRKTKQPKIRDLLARASELPSPAPPGHFLRQFGQSDREQVENSHTSASITQVLSLLNGFIDTHLLNSKSLFVQNVMSVSSFEKKLDILFLSFLSRYPTDQERQWAHETIEDDQQNGFANLAWTLLNTHEFRFVQ